MTLARRYGAAAAASPIKHVTEAFGLLKLSQSLRSRHLRLDAMRRYGDALRLVQRTLTDHQQTIAMDVFLACRLMIAFEAKNSNLEDVDRLNAHVDGCMAIAQWFPSASTQDTQSEPLSRWLSHTSIIYFLGRGKPLPQMCRDGSWVNDDLLDDPNRDVQQLATIAAKFSTLALTAEAITKRDPVAVDQLCLHIEKAEQLDEELSTAYRKLPPEYQAPLKIPLEALSLLSVSANTNGKTWPSWGDIYPSCRAAIVANKYRLCRIHVLAVIHRYSDLFPSSQRLSLAKKNAENTIRVLVDEICASISTFMCENATHRPSRPKLEFEGSNWLQPALFSLLTVKCVSPCQKRWIFSVIDRLNWRHDWSTVVLKYCFVSASWVQRLEQYEREQAERAADEPQSDDPDENSEL